MLNNDLSEAMKKDVTNIIKKIGKDSIVANITMTFTSPKQPDFKVYLCREIDSLTIHQDFVQNITDKIIAELQMERDIYLGLVYMRKNLKCHLEITYTKPDEVLDDTQYRREPDFSMDCMAILIKFEDLFKKLTAEQLLPDKRRETDNDRKTFRMTVELIDEIIYKARKEQIYITARDTNMKDMLKYVVNYFGFENALIIAPSNSKKYTNFVIPPGFGIEEIMSYIQNAPGLGIYDDGLISYVMNKMWYVYPRYGDPVNNFVTHVYCLGGEKYSGLNRMDWDENIETLDGKEASSNELRLSKCTLGYGPIREKKPIRIISSTELKEKNWSNLGAENEPTCLVAQKMDLLVDGSRRMVDDKHCVLERCIEYAAVVPPDAMDFENFIKIKHVKSRANMHTIRSSVRALQGTTVGFTWEHARPWIFGPATSVIVHYDSYGKMEEYNGICERAQFVFTKDNTNRIFPRWTCKGDIDVFCSVRDKGLQQSKS